MVEFDIPRVRAMIKYWKSHPPLHLMIAEYFGIKPEIDRDKPQDLSELLQYGAFEENPDWIPIAYASKSKQSQPDSTQD